MAELKPIPCEYCGEVPQMEKGVEIGILCQYEKFRVCCQRCNIAGKSSYDPWGAIEAWNRREKDE